MKTYDKDELHDLKLELGTPRRPFRCRCGGAHLGPCLGEACPYAGRSSEQDEGDVLRAEERRRVPDRQDDEEV